MAKQLCAQLITRALKSLDEDQEEIVVDALEKLGIETDIDMSAKDMCVALLEKTMQQELGKRVPISAYANSLLTKGKEEAEEKATKTQRLDLANRRKQLKAQLEGKSSNLAGCIPNPERILSKNLYTVVVDPSIGIVELEDGTQQYTAVISLPTALYTRIFTSLENPVIEISTAKGNKAYARLTEPLETNDNVISVSPLVALIAGIKERDGAFLKLCASLPYIARARFTYYGTKAELNELLPNLIIRLPQVVNAFSYLSLGMLLLTDINGREVTVRVDELLDEDDTPIFAGLISPGEGDLPFEIESDIA